ncbi:hypothetical protein N9137_04070 [Pseudomonadales bacterium]|nr:hypothetical protein [bacterium]MDB4431539.1 hypothetical protein [Pseudomonadales bacterium]
MFTIINTEKGTTHVEPSRPSWKGSNYKSQAAAKAGITRTIKFYDKAVADVQQTVKDGNPDFYSRWYNQARDAHRRPTVADGTALEVVALADYVEPQITRTGTSPYDGREITVTVGINSIGTHMDPLCESHYTR